MSSWFSSFFGTSTSNEPDAVAPTTSEDVTTPTVVSPTSAIPGLSEDQKEQIRNVIKKAELSKQAAKYVVDPRTIHHLKFEQPICETEVAEKDDSFDTLSLEENDILVQMDSLPETIEVTLGPSYGGSAMSLTQSEKDEKLTEPDPLEISQNVAKSMRLITSKIAEWVKSIEKEDHKPTDATSSANYTIQHHCEPTTEIEDYCTFLSRQICILAIAKAISRKNSESDLQMITSFAAKLTTLLFCEIKIELLERASGKNGEMIEDLGTIEHANLILENSDFSNNLNQSLKSPLPSTAYIPYRILSNIKKDQNLESQIHQTHKAIDDYIDITSSDENESLSSTSNSTSCAMGDDNNTVAMSTHYESLTTSSRPLPPPKITTAIQQLSLTEEELAHINYIKELAAQSSFEMPKQPVASSIIEVKTMEPVQLPETIEEPESSATSGADADQDSSSAALSVEKPITYERGSPLIDLDRISETEEAVPPPRPLPPPKITTAIQQLSLTEEELAHINYIKELAAQSSFEMPKQPVASSIIEVKTMEPVQLPETVTSEEPESSATSGADADQDSSSAALSVEKPITYERGSPLIDLDRISETEEAVPPPRPLPPPKITTAIQQLSLTEEELAHINYIKELAAQSSFEMPKQPVASSIIEVKTMEPINAPETVASEEPESSATSGADADQDSSSAALSVEKPITYERGSPLIDLDRISETEEAVPPPRPLPPPKITTAIQQLSLTEEELAHINYIKELAAQSSFEMPKQPVASSIIEVKTMEPINAPETVASEEPESSATSGADADQDSSSAALSVEKPITYERGSPLIDLDRISETEEAVPPPRPLPPPKITTAIQQLSLTEEELAHINYIKELAAQSSFEMPKQPVASSIIEVKTMEPINAPETVASEEPESSATSGADADQDSSSAALSVEKPITYERGSPLIDLDRISETEEAVPPPRPLPPPKITTAIQQLSLTEEELAHINYIKELAAQSSFEMPKQPVASSIIEVKTMEPINAPETVASEEPESSATSGADADQDSSSAALSVEKPITYERGSPLIDLDRISETEEAVPPPRPLPPPKITTAIQQLSLTEEELAHINYIKELAAQSSFEMPKQPVASSIIEVKTMEPINAPETVASEEPESSATSGADADQDSSSAALSVEKPITYERGSPLIDLDRISETEEAVPPPRPLPPPKITTAIQQLSLTEEELAHINYIKELAAQSSFEMPKQPVASSIIEVKTMEPINAPETVASEEPESSATSGADADQDSSSAALSVEKPITYERGSPLIDLDRISETEEAVPPPRPLPPPKITTAIQQLSLTEEELAHINYIKELAAQSSFEMPKQPVASSIIEVKTMEPINAPETVASEEPESSATSGADADQDSSSAALSVEKPITYERGSPLIDLDRISETEEAVPPPRPLPPPKITTAIQQLSLTEEELAHINYIKELAAQSSFEMPKQPVASSIIEVKTMEPINAPETVASEEPESSATSGADADQDSSSAALSVEKPITYERGSPLIDLDRISETEEAVPPPRPLPPPKITTAIQQLSLTEEELAHINYIKELAAQSSFEMPKQPVASSIIEVKTMEPINAPETVASEEPESSATSGADADQDSSSAALSVEKPITYERGSPLIDLDRISETEEAVPPPRPLPPPKITTAIQQLSLTEEELAHINYIKELAAQSSFEMPKQPVASSIIEVKTMEPINAPETVASEEPESSATSGADADQDSSSAALSVEKPITYERGSPLIDLDRISETEEAVPPPRPLPPPKITTAIQQLSLTEEELAHINYIKELAAQSSFEMPKQPVASSIIEVKTMEPINAPETVASEEPESSATSGADADQDSSSAALSVEKPITYERGSPLIDLDRISETEEAVPPPRPLPPPKITTAIQQLSLTEEELAHINYIKELAAQSSFEMPKQPVASSIIEVKTMEPINAPETVASEEPESSATSGADADQDSSSAALSVEKPITYERGSPLIDLDRISETEEAVPPPRPLPPPKITTAIQQLSLTEEELAHINYIKELAAQSSFEMPKQPVASSIIEVKTMEPINAPETVASEEPESSATSGADADQDSSSAALSVEKPITYERGSPLIDLDRISETEEAVPPPRPLPPPKITTAIQQLSLTEEELAHINYIKELAAQSSFEMPKQPVASSIIEVKTMEPINAPETVASEEPESSATSGADADQDSSSAALSVEKPITYERGSPLIDLDRISETEEAVPPPRPLPPPKITTAIQQLSLTEEELAHINYIKELAAQSSFEMPKQPVASSIIEVKTMEPINAPETVASEEPESSATSGADADQDSSSAALSVEKPITYERGSPLIDLDRISETEEAVPPPRPLPPPKITTAIQQLSLTEEELAHINYIKELAAQSSFEMPKQPVASSIIEVKTMEPINAPETVASEEPESSATSGADADQDSSSAALSVEKPITYERGSPLIDLDRISETEEAVPPPRPLPPPKITTAIQQLSLTEEELAHINYIKELAAQSSFEMPKQPVASSIIEVKTMEPINAPETVASEEPESSATSGADADQDSSSAALSVEKPITYERGSPLIDLDRISETEEAVPPPRPLPPPKITTAIQQLSLTEEELAHINYIKELAAQSSFEMPKQPVASSIIEVKTMEPINAPETVASEEPESSATSGADADQDSSSAALSVEKPITYERGSPLIDLDRISETEEAVPPPRPLPPPKITTAIQQLSLTEEELAHINYIKELAAQSSFEMPKQPVASSIIEVKTMEPINAPETVASEEPESSATSGADADQDSSSAALSVEKPITYERGSPLIDLDRISETEEAVPPPRPLPPPKITTAIQQLSLTEEELAHINYIKELAAQSSFEMPKQPVASSIIEVKTMESVQLPETVVSEEPESSATSGADADQDSSSAALSEIAEVENSILPPGLKNGPKTNIPMVIINVTSGNIYADCEARASVSDSQELCNVDFMVKLNFFAHRLTENIAEMAVNDLVAKIRAFQNPRARYFDEDAKMFFPDADESSIDESPEVEVVGTGFEVIPLPEEAETFASSLMSYFRRKNSADRPKSAMAIVQSARVNPVPIIEEQGRWSASEAKPPSSAGGDIMDLIRRTSISSEKANESPIKIPNEALAGLTEIEREHILKVLAAANRSQVTPQQSRRSSSAMYALPELEALEVDEEERKHIENVILKAEQRHSPFIIKLTSDDRRSASAMSDSSDFDTLARPIPEVSIESPVRTEIEIERMRIQNDIYPIRRVLERIDSQSEISSEQPLSPRSDITESDTGGFVLNRFDMGTSLTTKTGRRNSLSPSLLFNHGQTRPSIGSPSTSGGLYETNRRLSAPVVYGNIYSPLTPEKPNQRNVFESSDFEIRNVKENEPILEESPSEILTSEERSVPSEEPGLTLAELEHIQRMNQLAQEEIDRDLPPSVITKLEKEDLTSKESSKPIFGSGFNFKFAQIKSTMENINSTTNLAFNTSKIQANEPSKKLKEVSAPKLPGTEELSAKEIEHIQRITALAERESINSVIQGGEPLITELSSLSSEEREHINRVAAMAEQDNKTTTILPVVKKADVALSAEELEHIRKITELAELENAMSYGNVNLPDITQQFSEPVLTTEELEHISRIAAMAAEAELDNSITTLNIQPITTPLLTKDIESAEYKAAEQESLQPVHMNFVPKLFQVKEVSLSAEELEHISRIAAMAEQDSVYSTPMIQVIAKPKEPELSVEELEHTNRIRAMTDADSLTTTYTIEEEVSKLSESEITQEELEHIRKINEASEAELAGITSLSNTASSEPSKILTSFGKGFADEVSKKLPLKQNIFNSFKALGNALPDNIAKKELEAASYDTTKVPPIEVSNIFSALQETSHSSADGINVGKTALKFTGFGFQGFKKAKEMLTKTVEQVAESMKEPLSSMENPKVDATFPLDLPDVHEPVSIYEPTTPEFWTDTTEFPKTLPGDYSSADSAISLKDTPSDDSENLKHALSDYDMADEADESHTFSWYEQQLSQMNKSLDETFGMHPEMEKLHENDGSERNPSDEDGNGLLRSDSHFAIKEHDQALTNYTTLPLISKNEWNREEPFFRATGDVEEKINELAAAEVNCALQSATDEVLEGAFEKHSPSQLPIEEPKKLQLQKKQQIALGEKYSSGSDDDKKEEEESSSSFSGPLLSRSSPAVDATTTFQVEEKPESHAIVSSKCDKIDIIDSNQLQKTETRESSMFGSKSKGSSGFGGFGGLSKFASNALQNAKQAGEQLGAKAAQAAQAASTGDLTQVGKALQQPTTLQTKPPTRSQSSILPDITSPIPPGLEGLSQEERDKIMAVMACAEIDAAGPAPPIMPKIAPSRTQEIIAPSIAPSSQKSTSLLELSKVSNAMASPSVSMPITPSIEELGLSHLTPLEQEQILSVMRNAEMQDTMPRGGPSMTMNIQPLAPSTKPAATIVHEQLNDKDGSRTRKISWETSGQLISDQNASTIPDQSVIPEPMPSPPITMVPSPISTQPSVAVSDSGYITSPGYDNEKSFLQTMPIPASTEEIKEPFLPESFEIDEEPEEKSIFGGPQSYLEDHERRDREEAINYGEENEEWGKPEILQQYGGTVVTEPVVPELVPSDDAIIVTKAHDASKQVDAVELDEDIWMQPKHEYKVPEHWEPKSGRMWTTVFSDDADQSIEPEQKPIEPVGYVSSWSQPEVPTEPQSSMQEIQRQPIASAFSPQEHDHTMGVFGKVHEGNYDIQMDDPMSPTFILNATTDHERQGIKSVAIVPLEKSKELEEQKLVRSSLQRVQGQYQQQQPSTIAPTPEIKVTIHEEKDKGSDEESEEDTSPSSDEDDYPDQIIEAPSAPSMSFTEMEHERETQSAFAQEVLQQIQSFGESANDEFDVQWATNKHRVPSQKIPEIKQQPLMTLASTKDDHELLQESETLQRQNQRINPFLDSPEEEETDGVVVEQHQLDSDDIDYAQVAQYYRPYGSSDRIEQQQQQRKINTIPEGEEEDGVVNTEGRYHAKELERRPLHGNSVPPLVPPEEASTRRRAKTYTSITPYIPQTSSVLTTAGKTTAADSYYSTSQGYYISAGTSIPTSTWTTTTKPVATSSHSQYQQQQTSKVDPQLRVLISEPSSVVFHDQGSQLTPVRHAPPPPENGELSSLLNGKPQFKTDISAPDDLIPLQNHHPLHPHVHEPHKTPQHAQYQHDFIPVNSASDAAFLAQIGVSINPFERQTLGSQLPSANHAVMDADDDQITSRLKRSPAMILAGDSEESKGAYSYPPPTYPGAPIMHPIVTAASASDGISSGVLLKHLFVSDEDALLPLSGTSTAPTTTVSTEMGRRKLPSLPQPYMGTNSINAPIYYTSSGPEKVAPTDISGAVINRSGGSIVFDPSTASTTTRLTSAARIQPAIPTISSRAPSTTGAHPVDPSIIPGATFKVMQKPGQTVMMSNGDLTSNKQKKPPKMTDTMSRVMLKKELREVLSKRRDKLDACEIEANNRQYVINRMLSSGILPENRLAELNEIPAVIKCDLPEDITRNARVVPLRRPPIPSSTEVSKMTKPKSQGTSVNWIHEEDIRQFNITSSNNRTTKSIAVQCDAPPKSVGTSTSTTYFTRYAPTTSLKQQIRAEVSEYSQHAKKTVETQTDVIVDSTKPKKFPKPSGPALATQTTANGPDLIESTQRYFEEYDRRLKEAANTRLDKQRFNFTDNDIEAKRQQILNELAQRREKISSMVDLRYLQQQPLTRLPNQSLPSSDYASTVPHYGSLPRIDYPSRSRISPSSQIRDFTAKSTQSYGYNSLPRNYERNINLMEQSLYGMSPTQVPANMSRSMFNLDQVDSYYPSYMQQMQITQQPYARSSNYVDQLGSMDDLFVNRTTALNPTLERGNMLSQYANYLNNQFLLAQQNQFDDSLMTDEFNNLPSTMPQPLGNYSFDQASQLYQNALPDQFMPSMPPPPQSQLYDTFPTSQVYCRQERNYGSRPTQMVGDYGNYLHNRAQSLRQLDNLQDFVNHNVGVVPNVMPSTSQHPPTYGYYPTPWDNGYNSTYLTPQQQQQKLLLQQQQLFQQQQQLQQQQQVNRNVAPNTSYYDAKYPREDGLNRMYQTYGRRHRSPYNNLNTNTGTLSNFDRYNQNCLFIDGR